ncbi:LytR/AlgR family response regulator transcription factor [Flaviaesturariibacter aridisoli]|uniref:Response regulator n=1 Tax=Flaviaesturariibacter aridisoli TaxID=2545761 RepID=A0A4V2WMF2_9BACT|nr:LytTR family transcriptional regulator DNA-binding domain-containing protein [Flaviaesturariibacter aridisoli]TCZ68577.1 response regulator [Flaviaesturariibacter aridisoli]
MTALIIDDEPLARAFVRECLQAYPQVAIAGECDNGFEGAKAIQQLQPDLVFLDIQMPKINGFELLELLEQRPSVIFTTAYDEYALQAFEAHAVDYLLKPFSTERFAKAMEKFLDNRGREQQQKAVTGLLQQPADGAHADRIVVKTGGKIRIIPWTDIRYLEAADDYVKVHTADGVHLKNKTLGYYEQALPASQFVRVHRSYLANVQEITRIEPYEKDSHLALLKSGARIPVSRSGYTRLREVLGL